MSNEIYHIADTDGNPVCGAKDADALTLADPENIQHAAEHGFLCRDCEGE